MSRHHQITYDSQHPDGDFDEVAEEARYREWAAAARVGLESAESALSDAADAVGSALTDLLALDGCFELAPELTQVSRVLAMVQARVAERLKALGDEAGGGRGAPEAVAAGDDGAEDDRRLEGQPDALGDALDRDAVRRFAAEVLAEPIITAEQMRPLWAEGSGS